jgi:hypothetical protein
MSDYQVSHDGKELRAATTSLGTSFDSADVVTYRMQNWNQLLLFCTVSGFDATSVEIKVQAALTAGDATPSSWFDLPAEDSPVIDPTTATFPVRAKVYQMLGDGTLLIGVPSCFKWVRVVGKRTGGTTATTLAVTAQQGNA